MFKDARGLCACLSDRFINFISAHDAAICALESEEDRMVSSDDLGNIIVWQAGDRFKQILHIKGDG